MTPVLLLALLLEYWVDSSEVKVGLTFNPAVLWVYIIGLFVTDDKKTMGDFAYKNPALKHTSVQVINL